MRERLINTVFLEQNNDPGPLLASLYEQFEADGGICESEQNNVRRRLLLFQ